MKKQLISIILLVSLVSQPAQAAWYTEAFPAMKVFAANVTLRVIAHASTIFARFKQVRPVMPAAIPAAVLVTATKTVAQPSMIDTLKTGLNTIRQTASNNPKLQIGLAGTAALVATGTIVKAVKNRMNYNAANRNLCQKINACNAELAKETAINPASKNIEEIQSFLRQLATASDALDQANVSVYPDLENKKQEKLTEIGNLTTQLGQVILAKFRQQREEEARLQEIAFRKQQEDRLTEQLRQQAKETDLRQQQEKAAVLLRQQQEADLRETIKRGHVVLEKANLTVTLARQHEDYSMVQTTWIELLESVVESKNALEHTLAENTELNEQKQSLIENLEQARQEINKIPVS